MKVGPQQSFPFKAKGEVTLDQRAKKTRKNAVKFLKTVTPCTSCGQRGHWAGDEECHNRKKGKGAGYPKKKGAPKKKSTDTAFFVEGNPLKCKAARDR